MRTIPLASKRFHYMRILLLFSFAALLFSNCQNTPQAVQQTKSAGDLPKDFLQFYQKFHTDSAYQMAHIEWPLKGEKSSAVEEDGPLTTQLHEWEPETWKIMHLPDTSMSTLKRDYEMVGQVLIIERMSYPMVGFGYERQFYKEDDDNWRLIYYAEVPMK